MKDLRFNLPAGLVGDPVPFPQCPLAKFTRKAEDAQNFCPDNTVVGVASVNISYPAGGGFPATFAVPLFALTPVIGEPARFGSRFKVCLCISTRRCERAATMG